ncbi:MULTISPECIES: NADPH-dependent F420 reductase [unclassified Geodermatophilus]
MTTIGIIGAGHIGTALAQAATDAGYDVVLANSRGPETLSDLVQSIGARPSRRGSVRAATAAEAGTAGDLVVVTVPLRAIGDIPVEPLVGKVVLDTNNYYPERDGHVAELDDGSTTSSELLQAHLPTSRVVKAFNHVLAAHITARRSVPGTPNRRAVAIAGDDASAREAAASLIDDLGFDVVDLGPLAEGWRVQPGTPGYGPDLDATGMRRATAEAARTA